jgi:hypothetical protein
MTKLNLHQDIESIASQLGEFIMCYSKLRSMTRTKDDEFITNEITLEVGGYFDWNTQKHIPKVEIKITPAKK